MEPPLVRDIVGPNTDFGADRPASITGPWKNYKMCVATQYLEGDADLPPAAGLGSSAAVSVAGSRMNMYTTTRR